MSKNKTNEKPYKPYTPQTIKCELEKIEMAN